MVENNPPNQPLVSIVTPTYNRPEYLKLALISAVQQTYKNIEIIVSDNCSPQNPESIIKSFEDSRIRFVRNQSNLGTVSYTHLTLPTNREVYISVVAVSVHKKEQ